MVRLAAILGFFTWVLYCSSAAASYTELGPPNPGDGREFVALAAGDLTDAPASPQAYVRSLGDVNGDKLADFAVLSGGDVVSVRGLDGLLLNRYSFKERSGPVVDMELLDDTNGNGVPELVRQHTEFGANDVRDARSGSQLLRIGQDAGTPVDLEAMIDINGNGAQELVNLTRDVSRVIIFDGASSEKLVSFAVGNAFTPVDVEVYPDMDADGLPEIAVLANNATAGKPGKLDIRSSLTGEQVGRIKLSSLTHLLAQESVGDLDGDGYPEVAVLRIYRPDNSANVAMISTAPGGGLLRQIAMDPDFSAERLLLLADINGNGVSEVAIFGRNAAGKQKVKINDAKTGRYIGSVYFPPNIVVEDITLSADLNGNGSDELAVVGFRAADGGLEVIIKDSKSAEPLGRIRY